jgi:hypothetical protein
MRQWSLAAVVLLLAASAAAEDVYIPLSSRTELEITNTSTSRATVAVEVVGSNESHQLAIEPGQTALWSDGLSARREIGIFRIASDSAIDVKALSRCEPCGSSISLPMLDVRDALDEGAVQMRERSSWQSGMIVVNPGDTMALMTLTVHRGDELVDQSLLRIPPRGMHRVRFDRGPDESISFRSVRPLLLFGYDSNEQTGARVFTPIANGAGRGSRRRSVRSGSPQQPPPPPPEPQTIVLTPSKDNTLFRTVSGSTSNGAGVHLFAGTTRTLSIRRALLAFDVASQIPPGSQIRRATLRLQVSMTIAGPQPMTLHRVTADWGEGASNAGSSNDGDGATARTGDATWLHRFFQNQLWTTQGGDFEAAADATAVVQDSGTWETSDGMVARVQGWLDQPATNFGWLIRGNENQDTTAKRFDSREIQNVSRRPALTIEFLPVP